MFLYPNGKQFIINYLNKTNKTSLSPQEYIWLGPRALTEDEKTTFPTCDTAVQIKSSADAKTYGNLDLYYTRYDISKFLGIGTENDIELPISPITVSSNYECLGSLYQFLGIELTKDEVKLESVNWDNRTARFELLPNSLLWFGVLTVRIRPGDSVLSDLVGNNETSTMFSYPNFNTNNGQGPIYAYGVNFTEAMRPYAGKGLDIKPADLMGILATTGDPWTLFRSPSNWNLFESEVIYNGPNGPDFPTDPFYENVCVVKLALYCTNLAGTLYIQYNSTSL